MDGYACKECGASVDVDSQGVFLRKCQHKGDVTLTVSTLPMREGYACKECGAPATVESEVIRRTCAHTCGVTLSMIVTCRGLGKVSDDSAAKRLLAIFHKFGVRILEKLRCAKES